VRRVLLEQQAKALGVPLDVTFISKRASDEEYERELLKALRNNRASGVSSVVFGDIFLEDIRKYREHMLAEAGLDGIFPLWKKDTQALAQVH
jgi:diphthamide synthase (EF-2-diphthine--ammonia ligase)